MVRGYLSRREIARREHAEVQAARREAAEAGARARAAGRAAAERWQADGRPFDCVIEVARARRFGLPRAWQPSIEGWYLGTYGGFGDLRLPQPAALDRNGNFWLGRFDASRRALRTTGATDEKFPSQELVRLLR